MDSFLFETKSLDTITITVKYNDYNKLVWTHTEMQILSLLNISCMNVFISSIINKFTLLYSIIEIKLVLYIFYIHMNNLYIISQL